MFQKCGNCKEAPEYRGEKLKGSNDDVLDLFFFSVLFTLEGILVIRYGKKSQIVFIMVKL